MEQHLGEFAALGTALCWTVTSMAFEAAGKRVGALSLNLIRLLLGLAFLTLFNLVVRGEFLPHANSYQWFWLVLSGLVGFVLGDLFLFQAFIQIGARISMLVMSLVPPITALIAWITLGEMLNAREFLGMGLTVAGIALVLWARADRGEDGKKIRWKAGPVFAGVLLALGGAAGQATGLVFSKKGMQGMNAFSATQIRIIAGVLGFLVVISAFRRWGRVRTGLADRKAMKSMTLGAFAGPFLGVSLSLLAVQYTDTGVAATLMALTPVLIIPPAIWIGKERIRWPEILGAVVSMGGVVLFFL
ncbi:MAG: DMT family transporter [Bacteroidales bacterium]